MCYEKGCRCVSLKKIKIKNNVLRSLPCWYLWVNIGKKITNPKCSLTTCIVKNTSSHRGKTKGIFHIIANFFFRQFSCLWLKSLHTEDTVDFFPISYPGNAHVADYQSGTLRFQGSCGQSDPQRWRNGKEINWKWLLGNSSSYVTHRAVGQQRDERRART